MGLSCPPLSAKHDTYPKVRIIPGVLKELLEIQESTEVPFTLNTLANMAMVHGLDGLRRQLLKKGRK